MWQNRGDSKFTFQMKKMIAVAALAGIMTGCGGGEDSGKNIIMETTKGKIVIELNDNMTPITSGNFRTLVKNGFYDGLTFHRFVPDFVIQGGDPSGDGTGGSDSQIQLEIPCTDGETILGDITDCQVSLPHDTGVIAMARSMDPNSASSQFYFTLAPQTSLDGKYAVFGKVIEGLEIVKQLRQGDKMESVIEG